MGSSITIIALTTSACNLACGYCYVMASRRNTSRIPIAKVKQFITNCSDGFNHVEFCWHGGEPLLVGMDFYEQVIESERSIQQRCDIKYENHIQTNGMLMTEKWLDFLQTNKIGFGLSFDAPPKIHLSQRPGKEKPVEIEKYLSLFKKIKQRSLPLGLLCVVTKSNVGFGKEIFQFFSEIGADSYSLLPLIPVPSSFQIHTPTNDELFSLFKDTFDLWLNSKHSFKCIEPIDSMVRSILGEHPRLCTYASSCLKRMVAIAPTGEIVPCGSLVSDYFVLGNALQHSVFRAINTQRAKALRTSRAAAVKKWCNDCEYISICRGGCRENAFWSSQSYQGQYPYCDARKQMFNYIRDSLNTILCSNRTLPISHTSQQGMSSMIVCTGS